MKRKDSRSGRFEITKRVARTAGFAVRVFSLAISVAVPYSIALSKLRGPFPSDRYFLVAVRLLRGREKFTEPDFALLARAFNRAHMDFPVYPKQRRFSSPPRKRGSTSAR